MKSKANKQTNQREIESKQQTIAVPGLVFITL
jgi:hypothetical protein